jgi:hypothetical protein
VVFPKTVFELDNLLSTLAAFDQAKELEYGIVQKERAGAAGQQ